MRHASAIAFVAALALVPWSVRADDWENEERGWSEPPAEGYDVSVDVNPGGATLETFQEPLSPYGNWVTTEQYGQVWRPHVAAGWRPYYYGRWEWTNEGWLWVSDEPWGWAAYHYGRWAYDPYYAWIWVPGYQWAPAWVSWRYSGAAIGWAPLAPGFSLYVGTYPFVDFWWTFVPTVSFVSVPVYTVAYAPGYTRQWYYRTAPAPARPAPRPGMRPAPSPAPAWGGPAPRFVADRIGRPLTPARIVTAPSPAVRARPGEIPVFRPETRGRPGGAPGAAPPARRDGGWAPPSAAYGHGRGGPPAQAQNAWAPPGNGRGPGAAPAPGNGRGPGAAPAPGRVERAWSPPPGAAPAAPGAPAWRPAPSGGGAPPAAAPAPAPARGAPAAAPPARGGGGHGGGRGEHNGR